MSDQDVRGEVIDITDLHAPVLTDLQKNALAGAATQEFDFSPEAILATARARTGLDDFGAMDFVERLEVWCRAIDEDEGLSSISRARLWTMTLRYAVDRLKLEDLIKRHPEILDIEIERPIIVAGLPRSGTTHLLGLLSADKRLRSLPWWEATAPFPGPEDAPTKDDPNPRRTRSEAGWKQFEPLAPLLAIMHEFSADHISEDIELQALDFSSYLIEWMAHVPRWRDYYLSQDQTGTYAYLKKGMQALTFLKGPNRWVIKCPQHMEQLPALRATFPDAVYVVTHRDPVGSIQSALTMSQYTSRITRTGNDPHELRDYWVDRYRRLLERCVRDHHLLPPDQTIDVYFHEWIKDPDPILRAIYAKAGLALDAATLAELKAYHAAHDPVHKGKIVYNLERDFGTSAAEIRKAFGFYFDAFPVKREVK